MANLICIRHGQSQWNLENRFTGWIDIDLVETGIKEAERAGVLLKDFKIDCAYTSILKRAIQTLDIVLKNAHKTGIPIAQNQALNERHYGDLQGMNKTEAAKQFGEEQVHQWRRSYDIPPPGGESLKMTLDRVRPYAEKEIFPKLREGKNVLISAHGNSLRALTMILEKLSSDQILKVEIPNGVPIVYELSSDLTVLSKKVLT